MCQNAFQIIFATLVYSHCCLLAWLEGSSQLSESSQFIMLGNIPKPYMKKIHQPHIVTGNITAIISINKELQGSHLLYQQAAFSIKFTSEWLAKSFKHTSESANLFKADDREMGSGGRRDGELCPKQRSSSTDQEQRPEQQAQWVRPQMRFLCFLGFFSHSAFSHNVVVSTEVWSKVAALLYQSWPWTQAAEHPGGVGQGCSTCLCTQDPCQVGFASRVSADPTLGQGLSSVLRVSSESKSPSLPSTSSFSCFRPESPSQALPSLFNSACVGCPSVWEHSSNFSSTEILILCQKSLRCASEYTALCNFCRLRYFCRFGWNTQQYKHG